MRRLIPVLALAALAAACGQQTKTEEGAADAPTGVVSGSNGPTIVTTPGGEVNVSEGAAVVAGDHPAFAPAYPGGETVTIMQAVERGRPGGVYAFTTSDTPAKVFAFYKAKSEAAGLAPQTNVETGGGGVYGAQGPAGDLSVTVAPQAGRTYVQVTWSRPAA